MNNNENQIKNQKGISLISLVLVIIIVCLCIVLFMSISNKSDNSKIVGSWEFKYDTSYTFNKDGTGSTNLWNDKIEFTYKITSNKIYITYKNGQGTFENEFSIKNDKLYIGDDIVCTKIK